MAFISSSIFSQDSTAAKQKKIHSIGYSVYLDFIVAPRKVATYWDPDAFTGYDSLNNPLHGATVTGTAQNFGYSLVTFFYRFRYNIKEPNYNNSLGLTATPALGIGFCVGSSPGIGYFNLPIQIEMGFGLGSTYLSTAEKGGYIGAGFEINKFPLFYEGKPLSPYIHASSFWVQPVFSAGLIYLNKKYKVKEVNLKLGYALSSDPLPASNRSNFNVPPITARLSWVTILNY